MTTSEWMAFRFGKGAAGHVARILTAVVLLIYNVANITYFAIGSGKFVAEFLNIPSFWGLSNEFWASVLITFVSLLYTVASGLQGVVWTDVAQGLIIFGAVAYMSIKAMIEVRLPDTFVTSVPLNNGTFWTYTTTWKEWSLPIPKWTQNFPKESTYSYFNLLGVAIMMYTLKMFSEGFAGITKI